MRWADPRRVAVTLLALVATLALPAVASAHPLGNFTVNRAVAVEIGDRVGIRYIIDMAEIPAFETVQRLDTNADGTRQPDEIAAYGASACEEVRAALSVTIDGAAAALESVADAKVAFPQGVGGLETLRLECAFAVTEVADGAAEHTLTVTDTTGGDRIGWREVTARATGDASISTSDVPDVSPSDELTAYPQGSLTSPPDVRSGTLAFTLSATAQPSPTAAAAAPAKRGNTNDPLAALVGGDLTPPVILLALLVAFALGAAHAISPGHGKTLVAAYVLGAGGDARSAAQIGLSVAVSHTAGVFALGVLTLLASEVFLPERVIGWLSLGSGIIVAGLGLVLLARQLPRLRGLVGGARDRKHRKLGSASGAVAPEHHHDHAGGDDHHHDDGHDHGHTHEVPSGTLTWRSALALGFAGGAVPSASAVIVLLVAISTDRLLFGSVLIAMFGIGMAVVLGGLGLVIARVGGTARGAQGGWLASPFVRRIGQWVPVAAGAIVFVTGIVFAVTAANQVL